MKIKFDINIICISLFFICFVYACANRGQGPQGGPKDETPPKLIKSTPEMGAVNFKEKNISIEFDENVALKKLSEYIIISPPQKKAPNILARGKRVLVKFEEKLLDSTTYTINFGDAIVDLNEGEKNALKNFRFAFSTGNEIDTLGISGYLINAEDLNPMSGIIVGIYPDGKDSLFTQEPFLRIGKTNEEGFFYIDNVKMGKYKIFALEDNSNDYFFQPGEGLAMYDSIIIPGTTVIEKQDTIWSKKDSTAYDTVISSIQTRFLPDSLVLRFFKENKKRQYLVKSTRERKEKITLFFGTTLKELPSIETLNFKWDRRHIVQANNTKDTLNYWLTDSLLWHTDTLKMAVSYLKTDSLYNLVPTTDTINLAMRKARVNTRVKKEEEPKIEPLSTRTNLTSKFDLYKDIVLSFDEPLITHNFTQLAISQKKDTILVPIDYSWELSDSTKTNFLLKYKWVPGNSYELKIDSAAFISVFGKANNELKTTFSIRSLEEYSSIKVMLTKFDSTARIQILDAKDEVLATKPAEKEGTWFKHLDAKDYFLRMFIDRNGNGKWDTGNLRKKEQPEEVFYFPKRLSLKANFEFTEDWDHTATHILNQKPESIKKGKKQEQR